MPICFACPSCDASATVPASAAGKKATCRSCGASLRVPELAGEDDSEIVEAVPKRAAVARAVPARKANVSDDDDDDSDDDDRPVRKKKARKKGLPVLLFSLIGGGVLAFLAVCVGGYFLVAKMGVGASTFGPKPPPGFSAVGEAGVGVRLFIPGNVKGQFARTTQDPKSPINPNLYVSLGGMREVGRFIAHRTPGFVPGTTESQFIAQYEDAPFLHKPSKYEIVKKTSLNVHGHAGLRFLVKEKPNVFEDTDFWRSQNNQERDRVSKGGRHVVVIAFTNAEWMSLVAIEGVAAEPDEATVKTVIDSITFF